MKHWFVFLYLFFMVVLSAQETKPISGVVKDTDGVPLPDVEIFIEGTSFTTLSDFEGRFSLPYQENALICMYLNGFEKACFPYTNTPLEVQLTPIENALEGLVLHSWKSDNWEDDYQVFLQYFLGNSEYATDCSIKNPKKHLKFRFDTETQTYYAKSYEPLLITNKKLGYTITYHLEHFQVDFTSKISFIHGQLFFTEMKGGKAKQKNWETHRNKAYYGSFQHLIRTLYQGNTLEQGYILRPLIRQENPKYLSPLERRELIQQMGGMIDISKEDSIMQQLKEPKTIAILGSPLVESSSLITKNGTSTKLCFQDYLFVEYTQEKISSNYYNAYRRWGNKDTFINNDYQTSIFSLLTDCVEIFPNGYVKNEYDVLTEQYFSFEKIGGLLPLNYTPK